MTVYVDITGKISPGMWSYRPIIPDIAIFTQDRFATVAGRGWEADNFTIATLTGTYLETSKHHVADHPGIAEIPPERFFVNASIAQIPKGPRGHITVADLEASVSRLDRGDSLLVATGWDANWWDASGAFVMESPHFERDAMEWIAARGASIVGGDIPCFDDPQPGGGQGVNTPLFESGAMILAPLVGLAGVSATRARLVVLPLNLSDACGSPCRAILELE